MERKKVKNAERVENKFVTERTFAPYSADMDELMPQALEVCIECGQASTTMIRRKFAIGYPRAARIVDQMEEAGYVSKEVGHKGREVYITKKEFDKLFGKANLKNVEKQRKSCEEIAEKNRTTANRGATDELLPQALKLSIDMGQASATMIMRKFGIGYPRAAKLIDQMEAAGYISGANAFTGRTVYITNKKFEKLFGKVDLK